jgi:hypothetical protein
LSGGPHPPAPLSLKGEGGEEKATATATARTTAAQGVIDLFEDRPRTELELRDRLASIEPDAGRRLLIERLRELGAPPRDSPTLVGALQVLGLGAGDLPALADLLLDSGAAISGRAVALALVSALDPARARAIVQSLPGGDLMAMNDAQLTSVLATMPAAPARAAEITQKLRSQPQGSRPLRFAQIERIRRRLGIPAALLYRDALARGDLGLGDSLADRVVEEGGEGATILLEQIWRASTDAEVQATCMRALTRMQRTNSGPAAQATASAGSEPGGVPTSESAEGWMVAGEPPAEAISAAIGFKSAIDGSFTIVTAELTPEGSIHAAEVVSLASRREVESIVSGERGRALVSAPLAEIGQRIEQAARLMRVAEAPISLEMHAAICFFSMAARGVVP